MMPHLLVDISSHGFGHIAQTAPVVNELAQRLPGLRITLRAAAPHPILRQHFRCDFQHIPAALDFGMQMANAVDVEAEKSAQAYRAFHAGWEEKVAQEAQAMRALQPDLLLANVPYLSLAAASVAGVHAVAMCSLNWADIYRHYCAEDAACGAIGAQMQEAYNSARCFLKLQPAMPMADISNARSIGPVARAGRDRRADLDATLHLGKGEKLVLVAMGGIEFRLPVERWPHMPGMRWLVPQAWGVERGDMPSPESLGIPFCDVLASCDAVLTKPGYGTFAEAACAGVPVLYVGRKDWPEEPFLVNWLELHGVCAEAERERLHTGEMGDLLAQVWRMPKPPRPFATGAGEAAQYLAGYFRGISGAPDFFCSANSS
ncbi:MAG: hypothetical protein HZC43_03995 [Nitrosomonadales bacterium]|nr:hypothetical protein [Nitrosomonadales bacterium]